MSSPHITVTLSPEKKELKTEGWGLARVARAYQIGELKTVKADDPETAENESEIRVVPAALPRELWREPNTGIIMLRPSSLMPDFNTNSAYETYRLKIVDLNISTFVGAADLVLGMLPGTGNFQLVSKKRSDGSPWSPLTVASQITQLIGAMSEQIKPVVQTKVPLKTNEGFSVTVTPFGISTDRSEFYMVIHFGEIYALSLNMAGEATLWETLIPNATGEGASYEWVAREKFSLAQGGVSHTEPFTLTVLPWGEKYISFLFSNDAGSSGSTLKSAGGVDDEAIGNVLFDVTKNGRTVEQIAPLGIYEVTKAGHLTLSLWDDDTRKFNFDLRLDKVRYLTNGTFQLVPEALGYPRPVGDPSVLVYGYYGQRVSGGPANGTKIEPLFYNQELASWTPATDSELVVQMTLKPDAANTYSPEVWYHEVSIPAEVHTPVTTPVDYSDKWTFLRIQRSIEPDSSRIEVKVNLDLRTEYPNIFRLPERIEIEALTANEERTVLIAEGKLQKRLPVSFGSTSQARTSPAEAVGAFNTVIGSEELEGEDEWFRLNQTNIGSSTALNTKSAASLLSDIIKRAGYEDEDIEVVDDELWELDFEKFAEINQIASFPGDTRCGDAIREVLRRFGVQGRPEIRVVRRDRKWKLYLAEAYMQPGEDGHENPTLIFTLDRTLVPPYYGEEDEDEEVDLGRTDLQRWNELKADELTREFGEEQWFFVESRPEPTIKAPDFNSLHCIASTGSGDGSQALHAYIGPHPDVFDPTKAIYEGSQRPERVEPPEIAAQTMIGLCVEARKRNEVASRGNVLMSIQAEWQPDIDIDQLCMLVGRDADGAPCSFGAYRITYIDAELYSDHDAGGLSTSTRWSWSGNYCLNYEGPTDREDFPMISEDIPIWQT